MIRWLFQKKKCSSLFIFFGVVYFVWKSFFSPFIYRSVPKGQFYFPKAWATPRRALPRNWRRWSPASWSLSRTLQTGESWPAPKVCLVSARKRQKGRKSSTVCKTGGPNTRLGGCTDSQVFFTTLPVSRSLPELFATEHAHVRMLSVLQVIFSKPLEREQLLTTIELSTIFPSLDEIIEMHCECQEHRARLVLSIRLRCDLIWMPPPPTIKSQSSATWFR